MTTSSKINPQEVLASMRASGSSREEMKNFLRVQGVSEDTLDAILDAHLGDRSTQTQAHPFTKFWIVAILSGLAPLSTAAAMLILGSLIVPLYLIFSPFAFLLGGLQYILPTVVVAITLALVYPRTVAHRARLAWSVSLLAAGLLYGGQTLVPFSENASLFIASPLIGVVVVVASIICALAGYLVALFSARILWLSMAFLVLSMGVAAAAAPLNKNYETKYNQWADQPSFQEFKPTYLPPGTNFSQQFPCKREKGAGEEDITCQINVTDENIWFTKSWNEARQQPYKTAGLKPLSLAEIYGPDGTPVIKYTQVAYKQRFEKDLPQNGSGNCYFDHLKMTAAYISSPPRAIRQDTVHCEKIQMPSGNQVFLATTQINGKTSYRGAYIRAGDTVTLVDFMNYSGHGFVFKDYWSIEDFKKFADSFRAAN
jgi:hypothetical protein